MVWHDDGHRLYLQIDQSDLRVVQVLCPFPNGGDCHHDEVDGCMVDHFVNRFGLECHVGVCAPKEYLDIAWTLQGSVMDLDASQVWIIATEDPIYASWRESQIEAYDQYVRE